MSKQESLAFAIFAVLIIWLLNEIAFSLSNVKIVVAIRGESSNVIEGEAREVHSSHIKD